MDAFHSFVHWFVNMGPLEAASISLALLLGGTGLFTLWALSLANKSAKEVDSCREEQQAKADR